MIRPITLFLSILSVAACQHASEAEEPAVLTETTAETLSALEQELKDTLGKRGWQLDVSDIDASTLTLRPPQPNPLDMNNRDIPLRLSLKLRAGECLAVRLDTNERIPLQSVKCSAVND